MSDEPKPNFSTYGVAKKQDRAWVGSKIQQRQSQALIKHIFSHHIGMDPKAPPPPPCGCGYTVQTLIDCMEWGQPSYNAFHYSTAYRDYPRLIKRTPHLDHVAYCRMIAGYKTVPEVLSFFASSGATMPYEMLESILNKRFGGSLWNDSALKEWILKCPKSSRTGMYNRWRKCALIKPIVDMIEVAETMLG